MKFKTLTKQIAGTYTRDGKTIPVTRKEQVQVPVLPRNVDLLVFRTARALVLGLTLLSIVWSTYAIGELLGGGIGFIAAIIFDLGWAVALLLEHLARYDEEKRKFPKKLGWILLAVTMTAIAWHGYKGEAPDHEPNWGMAIIGAFVSFFAKVLWIAVMEHRNAKLSDEDKQWLKAEISAAQTKEAIASVRRQTARAEQNAALELLAMEKERREISEAFGLEAPEPSAILPDHSDRSEKMLALEAPTLADMAKSDAVRFVKKQHPELEARDIVSVLEEHGVDAKPDYVQQVLNRTKNEEPEAEIIELRK